MARRSTVRRVALSLAFALPLLACSGLKDAMKEGFNAGAMPEAKRTGQAAVTACRSAAAAPPRQLMLTLLGEVDTALQSNKLDPIGAAGVYGFIKGACEDGAVEQAEVDAARAFFVAAKG